MLQNLGSALAILTAAVHVFVGHFDTLIPLLSADLSPAVLGAFTACWHMISLFLVYSAWQFWRGGQIAIHLAVLWISFAAIFVAVALWQGGASGLLVLPQWLFLGPAGALILIGSRTRAATPLADR